MSDLVVKLGLDNREFKRSLEASMSQTQVAVRRIGQTIEENTKPIRKLGEGIRSVGVVAGLVAGAITGIASIISRVAEQQREYGRAILDEVDARRRARQETELLALRIGSMARQEQEIRNQTRDRLAELNKEAQKLNEELSKMNYGFGDIQGNALIEALTDDGRLLAEKRKRLEEIIPLIRALVQEEKDQIEVLRRKREADIGSAALQSEIDYLRMIGKLREAQVLEEGKLTAEMRSRIRQIAGEDEQLFRRLEEREIRRHQEKLREIDREEEKRRQQAAEEERRQKEQEERDRKQREQQRLDREFLEQQQEIERLRLTQQDKAAEALERELDHRRRIRDIERMEGIDEKERARLIANERRNFALRGADAAENSVGEVRQVQAGLIADRTLINQILGFNAGKTAEERVADEVAELKRIVKQWAERPGMVWA